MRHQPESRLASVGLLERACPVTTSAEPRVWNGIIGDSRVPVGVASTPRMRRFTEIWVNDLKRQQANAGAA